MVADLLPEIIKNILTRLCVKDLLRFRLVAKPWRSMIDGPDFTKQHLHRALQTASRLGVIVIKERDLHWMRLDSPNDVSDKLDLPFKDGGLTRFLGSCNGLLALFNYEEGVAIWNPTTRRHRKLLFDIPDEFSLRFGYDHFSDDFKLVMMVKQFSGIDYVVEVKVYSAKTDSWKTIHDSPYYLRYLQGQGVLVNNALHWIVTRTSQSDETKRIVAFDLAKEEYFEVPMPNFELPMENLEEQEDSVSVNVFEGSLCVVYNFLNGDDYDEYDELRRQSNGVDIWAMKEYGVKESWTKLFTFLPNEQFGTFSHILPVANLSEDRILLVKNGDEFITHDLKGERVEDGDVFSTSSFVDWLVCVESLVGLDGPEGRNRWEI